MRNVFFAGAATLALACGATSVSGQSTAPGPVVPPVENYQANPHGDGVDSPVPPNPSTASTPVPPAMPSDPGYNAGPYKGALTPPPPEAMNKIYPVCTRILQDSCRNPGGR